MNGFLQNKKWRTFHFQEFIRFVMPCRADFHSNDLQWKSIADPVTQIGKEVGEPIFLF